MSNPPENNFPNIFIINLFQAVVLLAKFQAFCKFLIVIALAPAAPAKFLYCPVAIYDYLLFDK